MPNHIPKIEVIIRIFFKIRPLSHNELLFFKPRWQTKTCP
jgi:hypothetical protein